MFLFSFSVAAQQKKNTGLIEQNFVHPPESAKPWVFWYWMHAAVSKAGITADLEAMKEVGIGGAYLMPIQDTVSTIPFQPTVRQLTSEWWEMVRFSMQEAKRLNLKLAMHVSDGFALAGGPWITPELSMQKLVWTKTYIKNGSKEKIVLEQPESTRGYYKDVAVFAYPANSKNAFSEIVQIPTVTASNGTKPQFLSFPAKENKQSFKSDTTCWIQYKYPEKFTCRSISIHVGGNNYQAQRLIVQTSNDGENFTTLKRLEPPRSGWQDTDEDYTYAIPEITAKYFRFVYDKAGTEPGAEDIDAAKWKPSLKVMGIYLSDEPVINQFESKNCSVWRVAANTTDAEIPKTSAISLKNIIDVSGKMDKDGNLNWTALPGSWGIVRIGHTSTGQTNATGGAGAGLECDKFNTTAIKLQFDNWFAKACSNTDPALAKEVLKVFHVDSWECGSQNWSNNFAMEFKKRRGYDLMPYLLVMTGIPVTDAATSEKVLHDVRQTIAELVNDVFYTTLKKLAHDKGCSFSAESIAPTMVSDGLLHYKNVDMPMGEFWLNSPTHDKPNDMLDAISGAHIYGKHIIGAESFTSVRMNWKEHPGNLKAIGDRNFALGINKMVLHVFAHNPWMDKKPGMTLDGVGLYFQRDQTWFKQSKAWIDYLTRCQALLQMGKPVVDIAVFTGEEVPRRSVLPDRLINTLPGIFGKEKIEAEKKRLENAGQPLRQIPDGVSHSANMADPENWVDPLNGYAYDSFNPDALMMMSVKNGRVVLPGGASYKILVIPGTMKMNPNGLMSVAVAKKLLQLVNDGATVLIDSIYKKAFLFNGPGLQFKRQKNISTAASGKGKFILTPYWESDFTAIGLKKNMVIDTLKTIELQVRQLPKKLAVSHRKLGEKEIYFVSNQNNQSQTFNFSFAAGGLLPEIYDPVTGTIGKPFSAEIIKGKIEFLEPFEPFQSKFIIFEKKGIPVPVNLFKETGFTTKIQPVWKDWKLVFKTGNDSVTKIVKYEDQLQSWATDSIDFVKYFSGTVSYTSSFFIDKRLDSLETAFLGMRFLYNVASVKVNGIDCGTIWTKPYQVNILKTLRQGENQVEIEVTNTWHNQLIGDSYLPAEKKKTFTTAPFRLSGKPLEPAGIVGSVEIMTSYYK
jgi:alpha-L-rhamnosidase